jgi:hypothetical protein
MMHVFYLVKSFLENMSSFLRSSKNTCFVFITIFMCLGVQWRGFMFWRPDIWPGHVTVT